MCIGGTGDCTSARGYQTTGELDALDKPCLVSDLH